MCLNTIATTTAAAAIYPSIYLFIYLYYKV